MSDSDTSDVDVVEDTSPAPKRQRVAGLGNGDKGAAFIGTGAKELKARKSAWTTLCGKHASWLLVEDKNMDDFLQHGMMHCSICANTFSGAANPHSAAASHCTGKRHT